MMHSQQLQSKVRELVAEKVNTIASSRRYTLRHYGTTAVYPDYFRCQLSYHDTQGTNAVHECTIIAHRCNSKILWTVVGSIRYIDTSFKTLELYISETELAEFIAKFITDTPEFD